MPRRFALPFTAWPPADRTAWERAVEPVDFFDDGGAAANWRPKSIYQARSAYGRWLAFEHDRWPLAAQDALADRVTIERVRTYVGVLRERLSDMGVAAELGHLLLALSALAPKTKWAWLRKVQYRFQARAQPREQRQKLIDPRRLIALGTELMDGADREARRDERARRYRDGLLIALLACRPLRRGSLAAVTLDRHVKRVGAGVVFALDGEHTKSRKPIELPLPASLTPYFLRYLDDFRLRFPHAREHAALWLSSKGGPLGAEAIYDLVCRRTEAAFGFAIHPHLFRAIAASAIAREAPEKVTLARDLLTHANLATTMHYYARAQTLQASRNYAALVARMRNGDSTAGRRRSQGNQPATCELATDDRRLETMNVPSPYYPVIERMRIERNVPTFENPKTWSPSPIRHNATEPITIHPRLRHLEGAIRRFMGLHDVTEIGAVIEEIQTLLVRCGYHLRLLSERKREQRDAKRSLSSPHRHHLVSRGRGRPRDAVNFAYHQLGLGLAAIWLTFTGRMPTRRYDAIGNAGEGGRFLAFVEAVLAIMPVRLRPKRKGHIPRIDAFVRASIDAMKEARDAPEPYRQLGLLDEGRWLTSDDN